MALKVWFEDDVRNALSAAELAANVLPNSDSSEDQAFVRGFNAAIGVLSTNFGLAIQNTRIVGTEKPQITTVTPRYLVAASSE